MSVPTASVPTTIATRIATAATARIGAVHVPSHAQRPAGSGSSSMAAEMREARSTGGSPPVAAV
jgi:acyl-coenzyme A synthetase/AMP-(fatty) acid ligase